MALLMLIPSGSRVAAGSYETAIAGRRASYVQWIIDHFGAMEPDMEATDGRRWALNHARLVLDRDLEKANQYFGGMLRHMWM